MAVPPATAADPAPGPPSTGPGAAASTGGMAGTTSEAGAAGTPGVGEVPRGAAAARAPDAAATTGGLAARRSLAEVVGRLRELAAAVQRAVEVRRAVDPSPDDPFRGLYLGDEEIDRLLADDVPPVEPIRSDAHGARSPSPDRGDGNDDPADAVGGAGTAGRDGGDGSAAGAAGAASRASGAGGREPTGEPSRLVATARRFGLDPTDVDLLLVALAPDVDSRFERFYGYLHDDVTRRRASIGLALELCGLHPADAAARRRLTPVGRLVAGGLVVVEDGDRPFLTRALRVPDRVTAHVLGGGDPDPAIAHLLTGTVPLALDADDPGHRLVGRLAGFTDPARPAPAAGARIAAHDDPSGAGDDDRAGGAERTPAAGAGVDGSPGTEGAGTPAAPGGAGDGATAGALVYVAESPGASGRSYAAAALAAAGRPVLAVDLARLSPNGHGAGLGPGPGDDLGAAARALGREARLRGAALVAGPVEALAERGTEAVRALADLPGLVVLTGRATWDPHWSPRVPVVLTAEAPTPDQRARTWLAHLDGHVAAGVDAAGATSQFRLTPEQVVDAAAAAVHQAALAGTDVGEEAIRAGARSRNGAGLEKRARRVVPGVGWDDLVLPPQCLAGLRELASRVRHREQVLQGWAMRPGGGRGRGITALFAGDSGTGKTMSAEVVAGELGLDLYVVDLATVVDKYVGETEKNLERIFTEADGVNGVLLFDEADALFGKRSEVRDAHDRYANIEVAYLLQRMESFDGLAILTTNLRANLDEAFTRRLDSIVDFPLPDEEHRGQLWERCLGTLLPRTSDVDLDFCADRFELTGGNIRSIAITAAYLAAERGEALSMVDLMRATQREYRKLGRLCTSSEFGPWLGLE